MTETAPRTPVTLDRGRIAELTAREAARLNERTQGSRRLYERARQTLIDFYVRFGTYEPYVRYGYGTWSSHVLSWLNAARSWKVPMHVVRFEALRDDGAATLSELATFLGMNVDDAAIAAALENCSLATSREMEERAIADCEESRFYKRGFEAAYARGWRYHGGGGSGYARARLSPAQWEAAHHVFGPTAAAIGLPIKP